jgi:hypothetical protein
MKSRVVAALVVGTVGLFALALATAQNPPAATQYATPGEHPRFRWVEIYVDSGDKPLAAYQLELTAAEGAFKIVGVEGGAHPAFATPPYYDPAALSRDHVILAAYNTGDELPTGKTRVARVHVMVSGATPRYAVKLTVAAGPDGDEIDAFASALEGVQQ